MKRMILASVCLVVMPPAGWTQAPESPLDKYRKLEFPPNDENFDKGWKDRVALEYEIVNAADLKSLRAALQDENAFVRSMAARALGVLGDKSAAAALAALARTDPQYIVRIRAVEALGFLKLEAETVELAKKDKHPGVAWSANIAAGHLECERDDAALARQAYAGGVRREVIGSAQIGQPAPDFSARTSDGTPFQLSSVLGKKPIAIYFAAFEG
jgi:HEAT repeats